MENNNEIMETMVSEEVMETVVEEGKKSGLKGVIAAVAGIGASAALAVLILKWWKKNHKTAEAELEDKDENFEEEVKKVD